MRTVKSEDGAILINVVLAIVLLIAVNVFVIDYGVMWVGRNQAQNSADSGAMAGALALAFDNFNDRTETGPAKMFAHQATQLNGIWGEAPAVDIAADITFPVVPADQCADNSCVRVDVYRNTEGGNPLPMLFGSAVGLTSQGVKAMAIARAAGGNASDCLKPWAIPDKWNDIHDEDAPVDVNKWTPDDHFELTYPKGSNKGKPLPDPDVYVAPTKNSPGTGFTLANDYGQPVTLKYGSPGASPAPGVFLPIDLPLASGAPEVGGKNYQHNISGCNGKAIGIGDSLNVENGNMIGPTSHGMEDLIALDPLAKWDPVTKTIENSCAQSATPCASQSPRIVAIPVYNTAAYETGKLNGKTVVNVVNILGFFVDKMQGKDVTGYFTTVPGLVVAGKGNVGSQSAFSKVVMLVR